MLALYARGLTTREIQGHLRELYGIKVSPTLISAVTDAVRRAIYTTNAIESIQSQLRRVVRNRGAFPTEDSVRKVSTSPS